MLWKQDQNWKADRARVEGRWAILREQSLWAIGVYRFGQRIAARKKGLLKYVFMGIYKVLALITEILTGIRLPIECKIGKGLRIWHFGGVFVNVNAIVGENCTMRQGVTIGNRYNEMAAPTIGNNVEIGAYAQILGNIYIGDNCKIGALTIVLDDMPPNSTAVGQKARIIRRDKSSQSV